MIYLSSYRRIQEQVLSGEIRLLNWSLSTSTLQNKSFFCSYTLYVIGEIHQQMFIGKGSLY